MLHRDLSKTAINVHFFIKNKVKLRKFQFTFSNSRLMIVILIFRIE